MTVEEAGQVILEGNKWEKCKRCDGTGEVKSYDGTDWVSCRSCRCRGEKIRLEWELAVNRLEMEEE